MNRSFKNIFLMILMVSLLFAIVGCSEEAPKNQDALRIETIKILPKAYINEPYDLWDILVPEDGVKYSATACYTEIILDAENTSYTVEEHELEVVDLCFTPVTLNNTIVTLTATRGNQTATKVVSIGTTIHADPLDDLYKSTGILGWAETGISKSVNRDSQYIKGENSRSSLHVKFDGIEPHEWGQVFMELSNENAQRYFTDQIWDNAIVTFWVYNPMEQDIEFQLTVNDHNYPVMTDWTREEGHFRRQFAKAGEWTQIFFSLRRMGTTHKLVNNQYSTETVNIKFQYAGYSTTQTYQFEFYLDDLDVVPASTYPHVDTTFTSTTETVEQGWENMMQDAAWQGATTIYDQETWKGEGSQCSLLATFDSEKGITSPFVVLNPEMMLGTQYMPTLPDMTGGTLTAYFKFENASPEVSVDLIKEVKKDWKFSNVLPMDLTDAGNGWYQGTVNVNDFDFNTDRNDDILRIRFTFSGVSRDSKVWIDTVKFDYKDAVKIRESIDQDWINLPLDSGMTTAQATMFSTTYLKASGSVRSLQIVAPGSSSAMVSLAPEFAVIEGNLSANPNMTTGVVHGYFYFGLQAPDASMRLYNANWKYCRDVKFIFENVGGGWYYGSIPTSLFQGYPEGNSSQIIRLGILIPAGYTVYLDGLVHNPNEEYVTTLNPDDVFASGVFTTDGFNGNSGAENTDSVHMWADNKTGWPTVGVSYASPVDISGYGELSIDVKSSNAHKWLGVKLGYWDANGVEQFKEVGVDFFQEDWQTIKVGLNQFDGVDLTRVTKIQVCVNMEDSFQAGGRNEFWLDNVKLMEATDEPADRGHAFKAGENYFTEIANADYESISFEYKLVTEGTMTLILRDNTWLKYFGDYLFTAEGEFSDYAGITTEKLEDGYIRVTMVMDELTRSGLMDNRDNAPETINVFDIYTTTTANGYVDNIQGVLDTSEPEDPIDPEKPFNPADIFASGSQLAEGFAGNAGVQVTTEVSNGSTDSLYIWAENKTGWPVAGVSYTTPVDISAYTDISVDVKAVSVHKWISIKLGYLDANGVEQFSEVGVDFTEDSWKTISVKLSQFAGADLTKVTKFMICVNLESGTQEGVRSELWLDNLRVTTEVVLRGQAFKAGEGIFVEMENADYASISFEYKLVSDGTMTLILRDNTWLKYFGDYIFTTEGEFSDYPGITTELLADGYIRVTMVMDELTRSGLADSLDNAPETINIFDVYTLTTADGYVDKIQGTLQESQTGGAFNPNDIFASGTLITDGFVGNSGWEMTDTLHLWTNDKIGWPTAGVSFDAPVDISSYEELSLDIKVQNTHKWFSIKIGYLNADGTEQFSEVGADFFQEDWQSVAINLSQFADADLGKVTQILVCVNLETNVSTGVRNEVWMDNLRLTKPQELPDEPGGMELSFQAYTNAFLIFEEKAFKTVSFDYQLETAGEMYIILRDGTWLKYYGDYAFNADGEVVDYAGITTEKLSNGYIRVTMVLEELERTGCDNNRDIAPDTLAVFDVFGTTTVGGHIKNLHFWDVTPAELVQKVSQALQLMGSQTEKAE